MIKKLVKSIWLIASLSAIFISCDKDDNVGAGLQSEEGLFSHFALEEELELNVSTILNGDNLITGGSNDDVSGGSDILQVGGFTDEFVGTVTAESYFQVQLTSENPDFGTNAVCDSVFIQIMKYEGEGTPQGNDFQSLNIDIHELDEPFEANRTYFSNESFRLKDVSLGSTSIIPSSDTLIAIKLENNFGEQIINLSQGITNAEFLTRFNGLGITSNSTDASIIGLDINSFLSAIVIYYHNSDDDGLFYALDMSLSLDHNIYFEGDRTGTDFAPLVVDGDEVSSSEVNNTALIHAGIGNNVFVEFENLERFFDTTSANTVVNLALIELPLVASSYDSIQNQAPLNLIINAANENGEILQDSDGVNRFISQDIFFPGVLSPPGETDLFFFNQDDLEYTVDLTAYFQEIISGEEEFSNLLLSTNFTNGNSRINRALIDVENIRFRLLYSVLD